MEAMFGILKTLRLLLALLAASTCVNASVSEAPNILLIMAEDLSARIGAFGDSVAVTPNLNALAEQGVRYDRVFTTSGVCAPSRAAQITGMHQISIGAQHMRAGSRPDGKYLAVPSHNVKAYPELLRAAGYYTFTEAKLDYQFSGVFPGSGPFTIWDSDKGGERPWRNRDPDQPFFGLINLLVTHESGVFKPLGSWPQNLMHFVTQVKRALQGYKTDGPVRPEDVILEPYYPDTPAVRADIARHYNNIYQMDKQVGEILAQLQADGLAENTVVIWTTDHGDGLPRAKRELYDSGLRVPMIIHWPEKFRPTGSAPGDVDDRLISFVDFGPTVLRMAGVNVPSNMHGLDFRTSSRDYIYASRDRINAVADRQRAVRDKRYKYIRSWHPEQPGGHRLAYRDILESVRDMRHRYGTGELNEEQRLWFEAPGSERLFDLQSDAHELRDVAGLTGYSAVLSRMRGAMDDWLRSIDDLSDIPESDMLERFWPGAEQPKTATPEFRIEGAYVAIESPTPGASIGFRIGDGRWRLYTQPIPLLEGRELAAKAVRYGWQESELTVLDRP
jgi:N-sulfoglucosamine sulfohydrolase